LGLRQEGDLAVLWVEDTGIGIHRTDLSHLFERFHRGRNAAAYPGSGLGLAIVKAVVERHEGQIQAERTEQGARFTMRIPSPRD
jgi:signal transduction histidine kinase